MKTNIIFAFVLLLILFSTGLSGQYIVPFSAETANTDHSTLSVNSDCKAAFSIVLDSMTSSPFLYHFNDLSTGNINGWYWDFGDGSSSTEQHPSHQFQATGTYKVCLTVADLNDTANCSDQTCQEIMTMDYFSLGGLVYAGEYPLNNPVMAGDTGIASLYRIVSNQIVFVEDQYFQEYGYYWFGYLFPGEYMVKVALTEGSTHFKDYFTTYFGDEISWTKAGLITVSDDDLYEAEIHLLPVKEFDAGTGIIRGYVNFEQDFMFSVPPMAQTMVILADKNHTPLLFTHPNNSGYFEFTSIPFDSYFLSADATGKPASVVNIMLSESSPVVEGINLTIFGGNISYIPESHEKGISLIRIYPNPVKENLHIRFYSGISAPMVIKIIDITGKNHYALTGKFEPGLNEILIPAGNLTPGIYSLILQPMGNFTPVTVKFVR